MYAGQFCSLPVPSELYLFGERADNQRKECVHNSTAAGHETMLQVSEVVAGIRS